jgi:hypothetical protein
MMCFVAVGTHAGVDTRGAVLLKRPHGMLH